MRSFNQKYFKTNQKIKTRGEKMNKTTKISNFCRLRNFLKISKKGQLGIIELKFFVMGLLAGVVLAIVLVLLANKGILPFKLSFLC